jgi:hypothetical protein
LALKQKDNTKSDTQIPDNLAAFIVGLAAQVIEQPEEHEPDASGTGT